MGVQGPVVWILKRDVVILQKKIQLIPNIIILILIIIVLGQLVQIKCQIHYLIKRIYSANKKENNNIFVPALNIGYPFQHPNKRNINQANNRKFSPFEKRMNTNSNIQKAKLNKSIHYEEMQIQTIYLFQN